MQCSKVLMDKLYRSWSFRQILIISLIIIVGLIIDLFYILTGIKPFVQVDDGYLQII